MKKLDEKSRNQKKETGRLLLPLLVFVIVFVVAIGWAIEKSHKTKTAEEKTESATPATTQISAAASAPESKPATDFTGKIPILMYHYVRDFSDQKDQIGINLSISPAKFSSQLDLIKSKGYTTINFDDLKNGNIPTKSIILSFDDGYVDFYSSAYPALKAHGMTAVSYVITGKIGGDYMTTDMIKELSKNGIEIGSHTISHLDLSKASITKATTEIVESKKFLEGLIGKLVVSFCYPSGKYNDAVVTETEKAGYLYATTTNSGIADFTLPFVLSRYRVSPTTDISKFLK